MVVIKKVVLLHSQSGHTLANGQRRRGRRIRVLSGDKFIETKETKGSESLEKKIILLYLYIK